MLLSASSAGYAALAFVSTSAVAVGCLGAQKAGQCGFALSLVASTLPAWFLAVGLELLGKLGPLAPSKQLTEGAEITALAFFWRLSLMGCWWIRIKWDGLAEYRKNLGASGRPVCIVCNHTSFLDTILAVSSAPLAKVGRFKMIVAQSMLDMPVVGRIVRVSGHLCVPFKTGGPDGGVEVDKDAVAVVMKRFEDHLVAGGTCAWFPEGTINSGDCGRLLVFRAGGFAAAVRHDVEIWCKVMTGNATCWGKYVAVGGFPTQIAVKFFRLCESSHELLRASEASEGDERAKSIYLANLAQAEVQKALDEAVAQGTKPGDNTKKSKSGGQAQAAAEAKKEH